jgi:hypothetical protein
MRQDREMGEAAAAAALAVAWEHQRQLGRVRIDLAWPSGIPDDVRDTLAAQLKDELTRIGQERADALEHVAIRAATAAAEAAARVARKARGRT